MCLFRVSRFATGLSVLLLAWTVGPRARAQEIPRPAPTPNDTLVSPEVLSDNRVTFRIYAPKATEVALRGEWVQTREAFINGEKMAKDDKGVWSITTMPMKPDVYRYSFRVDGVKVVDPKNPRVTEGVANADSIFEVPGKETEFEDIRSGPHGDVRIVWYQSSSLGTTRRMHIYTPPGYDGSGIRYPVLYLLHGGGDNDTGWYTIGRANVILDNLLANAKAKPMIVVMPLGHTVGLNMSDIAGSIARNVKGFSNDLLKDIIPYVEKNFRVVTTSDGRAIAGLSMGGMETLSVGLSNLDKFSYLGVFSAGIFPWDQEFEKRHQQALESPDTNNRLKVFWIACGTQDFLAYPGTKKLADVLNRHGIKYELRESDGGHTWMNWRAYLNEFVPKLFR
jgi:enterochelin esterase family protein